MKVFLLFGVFLLCFGLTTAQIETAVFKESIKATTKVIESVYEIYSNNKVLFKERVAPAVYKMLQKLENELEHNTSHILKEDLKGEYEQVCFFK